MIDKGHPRRMKIVFQNGLLNVLYKNLNQEIVAGIRILLIEQERRTLHFKMAKPFPQTGKTLGKIIDDSSTGSKEKRDDREGPRRRSVDRSPPECGAHAGAQPDRHPTTSEFAVN